MKKWIDKEKASQERERERDGNTKQETQESNGMRGVNHPREGYIYIYIC
jgi:hypothetical protein